MYIHTTVNAKIDSVEIISFYSISAIFLLYISVDCSVYVLSIKLIFIQMKNK